MTKTFMAVLEEARRALQLLGTEAWSVPEIRRQGPRGYAVGLEPDQEPVERVPRHNRPIYSA